MSVRTNCSAQLPKSLLSLSLLVLGFSALGTAHAGTNFYVRTDGGDATQCTGRADAAYPGSGTGQACAWKNPSIALPPAGTAARIAGGDTLLIGSGTYQIGSGGFMQKIPSGPTATAPTRFLGKPGATAPKLVGIGGIHRVLNLEGSSNVEVGNLEITDGSDCVFNHSNATATCATGAAWSRGGLYASASSNVWLHDLNIHGLAARGIHAGGLNNWTVERVKINRNGTAGWTGDIGTGSSNSGAIVLREIEIGWNGCGERVATGEAWACWGQQTGGYGDGLGTAATGGQWLIEDAFIHHNTSDGLDLLYMDGADGNSVTLRRVHSMANAGNQVKVSGSSLIENSVIVGHCTFFKGKYFMVDGDYCRAYGATLLLNLTGNDTAVVRHNTLAGEGDAQIVYNNGTTTDKIYIQNNTVVGFPYFVNGALRSFSAGAAPGAKSFSGNLAWNVASCPTGATCNQNPMLANMTLATFDAEPLAGSPVIDKAPMISAVTTDFVLGNRPTGAANDIGAYEFGAGAAPTPTPTPTPPTCTAAAPSVLLAGPAAAVAAGATNTYTVTVRNNDSTGCANTAFAVARTVPAGWTGTLSATSATLAPGASTTVSLAVTSPVGAAAGTYGIGFGVSSNIGSIHTQSTSATYSVVPPPPALTETVTTSKSSYGVGETVSMTARVLNNGVPVSGASVKFDVRKTNNGNPILVSATTDSSGYARASYVANATGTFKLAAAATSGSLTATARTNFSVKGSPIYPPLSAPTAK